MLMMLIYCAETYIL